MFHTRYDYICIVELFQRNQFSLTTIRKISRRSLHDNSKGASYTSSRILEEALELQSVILTAPQQIPELSTYHGPQAARKRNLDKKEVGTPFTSHVCEAYNLSTFAREETLDRKDAL